MTADSSANHHSHVIKGPNRKTFPSLWAKVVRGEHETTSITPLSPSPSPPLPSVSEPEQDISDCSILKDQSLSLLGNSANQLVSCNGSNGNVGLSQKPAWKPLVEADSIPVIDGPGWPALAKPTTPSRNKSSSSKSMKPNSDGSSVPAPNSQVQGQQSIEREADTVARGASAQSGSAAEAQNDTGAVGASARSSTAADGVLAENGSDQPLSPPPPLPPPTSRAPGRESSYRGNHKWEASARPTGGVGSPSHRINSSSRRGNVGPRPRGGGLNGGVYNYNHRHDHRNNWTASRGSNGHLRPTMGPPPPPPPPPPYRGFVRPPPTLPQGSSPFIPMRPFGNGMGLDMAPPPFLYGPPLPTESYWPMPLDSHPSPPQPPMFLPPLMAPLATLLLNQIDFYFSEANLLTDEYLKKNMDAEGWVPISLIASFRRVKSMTNNIELILASLRVSNVVEVQGDKVRRRNDWKRWVCSSSDQPIAMSLILENGPSDAKTNAAVDDESLKEEV